MQALGAARLGDQIGHGAGLVGLAVGAVFGAVAGAAFAAGTVASGGLVAGLIIAGSVGLGGTAANQLLKGIKTIFQLPDPITGALAYSTLNVTVNGRGAMRAGVDGTMVCAGGSGVFFSHPPLPIFGMPGFLPVAEGSKTVRINAKPAGRITDRLICAGKITTASQDVRFGGPTENVAFVWDWTAGLEAGFLGAGLLGVLGGGAAAVQIGVAAVGGFALILGATMLGFEALGALGDSLGEGYRDLLQGAFGMGLLLAGWQIGEVNRRPTPEELVDIVLPGLSKTEKQAAIDEVSNPGTQAEKQAREADKQKAKDDLMKRLFGEKSPEKPADPSPETPAAPPPSLEADKQRIKDNLKKKLFGEDPPETPPEPRDSQPSISGEIVDPPVSPAETPAETPASKNPYPPDPPLKAQGPTFPTSEDMVSSFFARFQGEPPRTTNAFGELVDMFGLPIKEHNKALYFMDQDGNLQPLRKVNTGDERDPAYVITGNDDLYPPPEIELTPGEVEAVLETIEREAFEARERARHTRDVDDELEDIISPHLSDDISEYPPDFSSYDQEAISAANDKSYPPLLGDPKEKSANDKFYTPLYTAKDWAADLKRLFEFYAKQGRLPPSYIEDQGPFKGLRVDAYGVPLEAYSKPLYFKDENGVLRPLEVVESKPFYESIAGNDTTYPYTEYPSSSYPPTYPSPPRPPGLTPHEAQQILDEAQLREITAAEENLENLLTEEESLTTPLKWEQADTDAIQSLLDKPKKLTRSLSPWKDISLLEEDASEGFLEKADYYVDENGMIQLLRDVFTTDKGEQPLISHNDPPRASTDIPPSSNNNQY
ncbi:MAG: hypothetical protein K1X48_00825 [Burkholderiaceae bacterium]|nr:hypothetical protein [Burkholderiaceae bacterium]